MTSRHLKILNRALQVGFCVLLFFGLDSKSPWSIPLMVGAMICATAVFVVWILEAWTERRDRLKGKDGEV